MNRTDTALARAGGIAGLAVGLLIVALAISTAIIHFSLGGTLFTLNGLGYLALASVYAMVLALPVDVARPFGWLPRFGLAGFALVTIGAYLMSGGFFTLGWITKGIEVAIVGLVVMEQERLRRVEPVAAAPYGHEVDWTLRIRLHLGAQPAQVDVDRAGIAGELATPDPLQQLLAGERPSGVRREEREQLELLRAKPLRPSVGLELAGLEVELDVL